MAIRALSDIQRDFKAWLEARLRQVDTGSSTVLYGLLLNAIAQSIATANATQSTVETAQGIGAPDTVAQSDLDDIAYNLNITRKAPSPASGFITFRRDTAPTTTIRVGSEDGSGGVIVGTSRDQNGAFLSYTTTATVFFTPQTVASPITGFYEVSAPILCVQPGFNGNQDAGVINNLVGSVQGVISIVNKTALTGGSDQETNASLAVRMANKILGFQPGIVEGLRGTALAQNGVLDASVVGPDNTEFQRSVIGGVDVVLKGTALTTAIDQYTFVDSTPHQFENRPVVALDSVVSMVGLSNIAFTENANWQFNPDTTGENRNSVNADDKFNWLGTTLPNSDASVVVTYTYDAIVNAVQNVLNLDSEHFPSAQILAKSATPVLIDISLTISRTGSVNSTTITSNIGTAISQYLDTLPLGAKVTQSNLLKQIKSVAGIKQLQVPFAKLAIRGNGGTADIQLTLYQYPTMDTQSLTVSYLN